MPATNAMILISMFQFLNISFVYILAEYYSFVDFNLSSKYEVYYYTIPFGLAVYAFNYFYLYKNREKLSAKYKNESKRQKKIGNILLMLYVLGSIFLVFGVGPKYIPNIIY